MPIDMVSDKIMLDSKGGTESTQLLLEGDIIVPDIKPDIADILKTDGRVYLTEEKNNDGRVDFKGYLDIGILYYGKKSENPVSAMKGELPFEDFINIDAGDSTGEVQVYPKLLHMEYKLVNDRKISIRAVVEIKAVWQKQGVYDIVTDVNGGDSLQSKKGILAADNVVENVKDKFTVRQELTLPGAKPNIGEILETTAELCHREVKPMDGRISIKGEIKVTVLYIGETEDGVLELAEFEVPFNGFVDAKKSYDNMICLMKLDICDIKTKVSPDDDGEPRVIDLEVTMSTKARVLNRENIEVVEDAYMLSEPVEISKDEIEYMKVVGRNKAQGVFRETVEVDEKSPDIMQVIKTWGEISADEYTLKDDAVLAEGSVKIRMLYIAKDDNKPVGFLTTDIPFEQTIEIKGARPTMDYEVNAEIEDISYNMLSEREVEIRVTISFDAIVTEETIGDIITNIKPAENAEQCKIASVVIYTVQKGDSLWEIAKKYNTTVEDIVNLNELSLPDEIYPGQKFLILKRIC